MYNYLCVILGVISIISPIFTESIVKGNKEKKFNLTNLEDRLIPFRLN